MTRLRVMTWNLLWRDGGNWRRREPRSSRGSRHCGPMSPACRRSGRRDGTTQADVLADQLGLHAAFAAPSLPPPPQPAREPDHEGVAIGVAVLSRWPIVERAVHRLPAAHRHRPVALRVTVAHPAGPLQVLLAADLNASAASPEVRALTAVMVDTWVAGGGDPEAVTLSSRNPLAPLQAHRQIDQRIDHVLARPGSAQRPVVVRSAFALDGPVGGVHPSDHAAVVADLDV